MKTTKTFHAGLGRASASLVVVLLLGWVALGSADPPEEGFPLIRLERCMGSSDVPQVHWRPASEIREVTRDEIPSWVFSGSRLAHLPVTEPGDSGYEVWAAVHKVADPDPDGGPFSPSKFEADLAIHTLELDIDAKPGDPPTTEHWYLSPLSFGVDESDEEAAAEEEKLEPGTFFALDVEPPVVSLGDPDESDLVTVTLTTMDSAMRAQFWSEIALVLQLRRPSPEILLGATGCAWAEGGRCWDWRVDHRSLACSASWVGDCKWNLLCTTTLLPYDELREAWAVDTFRIGDDLSVASHPQARREPRMKLAEVAALAQGNGGVTSQLFRTTDGGLATPVVRIAFSEEHEASVVMHFPPKWPGRPRPAVVFLKRGQPVEVVEPDPVTWTPDPDGFFERRKLPGDLEVDDVVSKLVAVEGSGSFRAVEVLSRWGADWWLFLVGVSWNEGAPAAGVFSLARLVLSRYLGGCVTYLVPSTALEILGSSLSEGTLRCRVQGPVRCPAEGMGPCEWMQDDDRSGLAGTSAPYLGEVSWRDGGWHVELPEKDSEQFVLLPELDRGGSRLIPISSAHAFYPDTLWHRLDKIFGPSSPENSSASPERSAAHP